jgi:lipid-A-disaccharide synthase
LLSDTETRMAQVQALARIPDLMRLDGTTPSAAAAKIVLELAEKGRVRA